jgi:hypothetical protein
MNERNKPPKTDKLDFLIMKSSYASKRMNIFQNMRRQSRHRIKIFKFI